MADLGNLFYTLHTKFDDSGNKRFLKNVDTIDKKWEHLAVVYQNNLNKISELEAKSADMMKKGMDVSKINAVVNSYKKWNDTMDKSIYNEKAMLKLLQHADNYSKTLASRLKVAGIEDGGSSRLTKQVQRLENTAINLKTYLGSLDVLGIKNKPMTDAKKQLNDLLTLVENAKRSGDEGLVRSLLYGGNAQLGGGSISTEMNKIRSLVSQSKKEFAAVNKKNSLSTSTIGQLASEIGKCDTALSNLKAKRDVFLYDGKDASMIQTQIDQWQKYRDNLQGSIDAITKAKGRNQLKQAITDANDAISDFKKNFQSLQTATKTALGKQFVYNVNRPYYEKVQSSIPIMDTMINSLTTQRNQKGYNTGEAASYMDKAIRKAEELRQKLASISNPSQAKKFIQSGQYREAISEIEKLTHSADNAKRALDKLERGHSAIANLKSAANGLETTIANAFSVYGVERFLQSVIQIGGEFQKQHVALASILNDASRADKLFNDLKGLAVESPFKFGQLTGYAKQLAAFSVPYEELYDTTKRLADVSAGLGVDMSRIILAYGQVRSAEFLRGQELRQFTEAGIPLLQKLADKFTVLEGRVVSVGEVFERVSKKEVTFGMVKDVMFEMTEEGGQFFEMQAVLTDTLAGSFAKLVDSWEIMLSEVADSGLGDILRELIGIATAVMSKWEDFGYTVMGIVVAGAIKQVIGTAFVLGEALFTAAMSNPWTALVQALIVVGTTIYGVVQRNNEMAESFRKAEEEASNSIAKAESDLQGLLKQIEKTTVGTKDHADAISKLQARYGQFISDAVSVADSFETVKQKVEGASLAIRNFYREKEYNDKVNAVEKKYGSYYGEDAAEDVAKGIMEGFNVKDKSRAKTIARALITMVESGSSRADIDEYIKGLGKGFEGGYAGLAKTKTFNLKGVNLEEMLSKNVGYFPLERIMRAHEQQKKEIAGIVAGLDGYLPYDDEIKRIEEEYERKRTDASTPEKILKNYELEQEKWEKIKQVFVDHNLGNSNKAKEVDAKIADLKALQQDYLVRGLKIFGTEDENGNKFIDLTTFDTNDKASSTAYLKKLVEAYNATIEEIDKLNKAKDTLGDKFTEQDKIDKLLEKKSRIIEYFGGESKLSEYTKKKTTTANTTDDFYQQFSAKFTAVKDAYAAYKNLISAGYSKEDAFKGVSDAKLLEGFGIDTPDTLEAYKKAVANLLEELEAELKNKSTDQREKLKEQILRLLFIDIPVDEIKQGIEGEVEKVERALELNGEKFDFMNRLFGVTGNGSYFGKRSESIKDMFADYISDGIDPVSLIGLSDTQLAEKLKDRKFVEPVKLLVSALKDAIKNEKQEVEDAIYELLSPSLSSADKIGISERKWADYINSESFMQLSEKEQEDARKNHNKELAELQLDSLKTTNATIMSLFDDATNNTIKDLHRTRKEVKALLDAINEGTEPPSWIDKDVFERIKADPEVVSELMVQYTKLDNMWSKLGDSGVFGAIGNIGSAVAKNSALKMLKNQLKELELDKEANKDGIKETKDQIKSLSDEARGEFADGMILAAGSVQTLANKLLELGEATGDVGMQQFAETTAGIAQNLKAAAEGYKSTGHWIGAVVGGLTDLANQAMDGVVSSKIQAYQYEQSQRDFARALNLLAVSVDKSTYETIFGTDEIGYAIDSYYKAIEAITEYERVVNGVMSPAGLVGESKNGSELIANVEGATYMYEDLFKEYRALQTLALKTNNKNWIQEMFGSSDEWKSLYDIAPQLWGGSREGEFDADMAQKWLDTYSGSGLTDEIRGQIEYAIDLKNAYKEAKEAMNDLLNNWYGDWSSNLTDTIFDSILSGADAWTEFEKAGADAVISIGKSMINSVVFNTFFKDYEEELQKAFGAGNPADAMLAITADMYEKLPNAFDAATAMADSYIEAAKNYGFNFSALEDSANKTSASIKGIQEETANILAAYMNSINANVSVTRNYMDIISNELMPEQNAIMMSQLAQLDVIAYNTYIMASNMGHMREDFSGFKKTIDQVTEGVKSLAIR